MIELKADANMREYQSYIYQLEKLHGWLDVDLVHNCFLMGEEMGELFKSIRRHQHYFDSSESAAKTTTQESRAQVAEELVDVFNYLLAIANRLEIDMEQAFRKKNQRNQSRKWSSSS